MRLDNVLYLRIIVITKSYNTGDKMAKTASTLIREQKVKKVTSIGKSIRSKPKNKSAKRNFKKYRGQGK